MTITDTVEYGQLKLGHRDEALVLCIRPLIDKLTGAVTSAMVGYTAVWVGICVAADVIVKRPVSSAKASN